MVVTTTAHGTLLRDLLRNPVLVFWSLFLMSIPFYVFESGLPQPGNILILIVIPLTLYGWNGRLSRGSVEPLRRLAQFTFWVLVVNVGWALVFGNWALRGDSFLIIPFYYFYNLLIFFLVLVLHQRYGDRLLVLTTYAVSGTVLFQVVASFVTRAPNGLRSSLFFNSANQLGFYALLAACVVAMCQRRAKFGVLPSAIVLLGCSYLAFLSASRAAVGGIGVLFILLVFENPRIVVASSIAIVAALSLGGPVASLVDTTNHRIEYRSGESLIEGRGYDRIWTHSEHLVLGAGEGGKDRFAEEGSHAMEIHSSVGTVLFSYGILGMFLFCAFAWSSLRGGIRRTVLMLVPAIIYTFTHQGLRFTMLWILFGLVVTLKNPRVPTVRD